MITSKKDETLSFWSEERTALVSDMLLWQLEVDWLCLNTLYKKFGIKTY